MIKFKYINKNRLLLWFFIAIIFKQILWIGIVPLWQFPDEQAHFGQVQNTAEFGSQTLYEYKFSTSSDEIAISEKYLDVFRDGLGRNKYTYNPQYNLQYSKTTIGIYEENIKKIPRQYTVDEGLEEATFYPFFSYFFASLFYNLNYLGDLFVRVFTIRFSSLLIFVANIFVVFLIGKKIFEDKIGPILLSCLVAFQPMFSFIGVSINSDVMFNFLFILFLYACILVLEKFSLKNWLILIISLILGFLTKQQMAIALLILPIIFVFRFKKITKTIFANKSLNFVGAIVLLALLAYTVKIGEVFRIYDFIDSGRHDNPLSNLGLFEHLKWSLVKTYRETLPWYWEVFKWLGVVLPRWINRVQMSILVLSSVGICVYLFRQIKQVIAKKGLNKKTKNILFLLISSIIYYLAVIAWDWLFRRSNGYSFGVQGRYFFPTIVGHMIFIMVGLRSLTAKIFSKIKWCYWQLGLILWWIVLQIVGLYTVVNSYYDLSSWSNFIIQASQYKPAIFKGDWWNFWILATIVSLVFFIVNLIDKLRLLTKLPKTKNE
jgi:4-amino-4-deoxy-L-arabinose transferase-like glycosyltransferase